MKPLTEKAAGGNGDMGLWMEYEAEVNRDPSEYRRGVAPEDRGKLNQAAMLEDSFLATVFNSELQRWFDDQKRANDQDQS